MFFGGLLGLNRFHPDRLDEHPRPPAVMLTAFKKLNQDVAFDRAVSRISEIELSYRDNFVAFELAVLDYRDPSRNRYAYRLESQDDGWVEAGHRRLATYTNLRGGEYVFRFKGADSDGVWSEASTGVRIRVAPPYWATWWFRFLALGGLLTVCFGGTCLWARSKMRRQRRLREGEREARARLLEVREKERVRLARELHDGPVQDLYGVRLQLKALAGSGAAEGSGERLRASLETLRSAGDELRALCRDLRPPALAPRGLAAAIRSHARLVEDRHPELAIELSLTPDGQALPELVRLGLYRVFQESLNNAARHAGARNVRVRFELDAERALLEVEDDGRGFDVPERWVDLARRGHLGLLGIAERVDALGGELAIVSSPLGQPRPGSGRPGRGTRIRVAVPRGTHPSAEPRRPEHHQRQEIL